MAENDPQKDQATLVRNQAQQLDHGGEDDPKSVAGLALTGEAHGLLAARNSSAKAQREFIRRLALGLITDDHLDQLSEAVENYIGQLEETLAGLELQRDQKRIDLERHHEEFDKITASMTQAHEGIGRIESGEELERSANGSLKNAALEALVSDYEKRNGVQIDRGDNALLLAVLRAEHTRLGTEREQLGQVIIAEKAKLAEFDSKIEVCEIRIGEARAFQSALKEIDAIDDPALREERLAKLLEAAPQHILEAVRSSPHVSPDLGGAIQDALDNRADDAEAEAEADQFLDGLMSQEPEEMKAEADKTLAAAVPRPSL